MHGRQAYFLMVKVLVKLKFIDVLLKNWPCSRGSERKL